MVELRWMWQCFASYFTKQENDYSLIYPDKVGETSLSQQEEKLLNDLMGSIREGDDDKLKRILGQIEQIKQIESNQILNQTCSENTPLIEAIKCGNDKAVEELLNFQLDLNVPDNKFKETAVCYAIQKNNMKALEKILGVTWKPDGFLDHKIGHTQRTALHCASEESLDAVEILLTQDSIDPNLQDKEGNTPLQLAVMNGKLKVVWKLCRFDRTKFTIMNKNGLTATKISSGDSADVAKAQKMINMFIGKNKLEDIYDHFWPASSNDSKQDAMKEQGNSKTLNLIIKDSTIQQLVSGTNINIGSQSSANANASNGCGLETASDSTTNATCIHGREESRRLTSTTNIVRLDLGVL